MIINRSLTNIDANSKDASSDEIKWIQAADGASLLRSPPLLFDFITGIHMARH